jgi:tRNA-splicing ligase RtcB
VEYRGRSDFGLIAQMAAVMAKRGDTDQKILDHLRSQFGNPVLTMGMREKAAPFKLFGELGVDFDYGMYDQMKTVMRTPTSIRGAVLPDGHLGYGVPIGGVVETEGTVFPGWVGYDISCMMMLSVMETGPETLRYYRDEILRDLVEVTSFGMGSGFQGSDRRDHLVMEDPLWDALPHLKRLKSLAHTQLGSSGGGNHFADLMTGELTRAQDFSTIISNKFTALMTHSGSRGVGHKMATYYVNLAKQETVKVARGIPSGYEWLSVDSEAGQEYLAVMELMGRYALANHQLIHGKFFEKSGIEPFNIFWNRHNYAWVDEYGAVLHRKGATPAEKGTIGIIPGSSGTPSYIVKGLGNEDSLNSSSHGAGRPYSRTEAKKRHDATAFKKRMEELDIRYVGVAPDETLFAYKDIDRVMRLQEGITVDTFARMMPVAVVMGGRSDDGD